MQCHHLYFSSRYLLSLCALYLLYPTITLAERTAMFFRTTLFRDGWMMHLPYSTGCTGGEKRAQRERTYVNRVLCTNADI